MSLIRKLLHTLYKSDLMLDFREQSYVDGYNEGFRDGWKKGQLDEWVSNKLRSDEDGK